jgi:hypothetical protein
MQVPREDTADFPEFVREALGAARIQRLADLEGRVGELHALTVDTDTTEIVLVPMTERTARTWQQLAEGRGEDWVFIKTTDGQTVLAVDEPSDRAQDDPAAAVVFPEIHTRLVSWWLVHAWRTVDLFQDTLESLRRWRITSTAVTARALIEEAACFAYEATKLTDAWQTVKTNQTEGIARVSAVRAALSPELNQAGFGSRTKELSGKIQATNVLTYTQKLIKTTGDARFGQWYDWLSDAAHPAFGARIALASPVLGHDSKAVMVRHYARSPLVLKNSRGERTALENPIALYTADALVACGVVLCGLLNQTLATVDDFGLTTKAATFTRRTYWRDFKPVRGSRACPCGRGKWSMCPHSWNRPAPSLSIPHTGQ